MLVPVHLIWDVHHSLHSDADISLSKYANDQLRKQSDLKCVRLFLPLKIDPGISEIFLKNAWTHSCDHIWKSVEANLKIHGNWIECAEMSNLIGSLDWRLIWNPQPKWISLSTQRKGKWDKLTNQNDLQRKGLFSDIKQIFVQEILYDTDVPKW